MKVLVENVLPNPDQPRTIFDQAELDGLAQSIKESGLVQPIVVEQADDKYIIVDGERRWRAHQIAGLTDIEVVVKPASNHNGAERLTRALVANVQRSAMGFIDEAKAYQRLISELGSPEAVSQKTGVNIHTITARLRLLSLSDTVQKLYNVRKLPFDLSVIACLERLNKDQQDRLVSTAVTRGWKTTTILRAGQNMFTQQAMSRKRKTREPKVEEKLGGGCALRRPGHGGRSENSTRASYRRTCHVQGLQSLSGSQPGHLQAVPATRFLTAYGV